MSQKSSEWEGAKTASTGNLEKQENPVNWNCPTQNVTSEMLDYGLSLKAGELTSLLSSDLGFG